MAQTPIWSSDALKPTERQLIVVLATQTGDQAHVAAAAALDERTDVFIIFNLERSKEKTARDAGAQYFQRPTGNDASRVRQICVKEDAGARRIYNALVGGPTAKRWPTDWVLGKVSKDRKTLKPLLQMTNEKNEQVTDKDLQAILKYSAEAFYQALPVVPATFVIAERMAAANTLQKRIDQYGLITKRMGSDLNTQTILKHDDFKNVLFPTGQKPVLLLWARYTGSNTPTGYNPEGDSDLLGQKQLLQMAENTLGTFDVITVGHDPAGVTEKDWVHAKCHIGEFYLKPSIGFDRGRQLSFMLALMEKYPGKLFQIGQKTGGMDAGALAGIPTLYIEDNRSRTRERMQSWVGSVPFYSVALITEPPTLLGRALRDVTYQLENVPEQTPESRLEETTEPKLADLLDRIWPPADKEKRVVDGERGRRWVQYYYVTSMMKASTPEVVDIAVVKQAIDPTKGTVDPAKAKATDEEIIKTADLLQKQDTTVRGYNKKDIDLIQQQLVDLVAAYSSEDAVVRNSSGQYVVRKTLSKELPK